MRSVDQIPLGLEATGIEAEDRDYQMKGLIKTGFSVKSIKARLSALDMLIARTRLVERQAKTADPSLTMRRLRVIRANMASIR